MEIQTFNPKIGFAFETGEGFPSRREQLLYFKWKFWKNGISPREFNKCHIKDIIDVIDIEGAFGEKNQRTQDINKAISEIKW